MSVIINGKSYKGNNLSISGNKVYIDGKLVTDEDTESSEKIQITIEEGAQIETFEIDGDAEINGNVSGNVNAGTINCNDIKGNASAGGSIRCDDIGGNASSGGSIRCDDIGGNANAGGSIRN